MVVHTDTREMKVFRILSFTTCDVVFSFLSYPILIYSLKDRLERLNCFQDPLMSLCMMYGKLSQGMSRDGALLWLHMKSINWRT